MTGAGGETRGSRNRSLGIRGRLWLALACISALPVLSTAVSYNAFERIGGAFDEVAGHRLPQIASALSLVAEGERIVTLGPSLVRVASEEERAAVAGAIVPALDRARRSLADLGAAAGTAAIAGQLDALGRNLAELDRLVAGALADAERLRTVGRDASTAGQRLLSIAEMVAVQHRRLLADAAEQLAGGKEGGKDGGAVVDIQVSSDILRAMGRVAGRVAALQATLGQIAVAPRHGLDQLQLALGRDIAALATVFGELPAELSGRLAPLLRDWQAIAEAKPTEIRRARIDAEEAQARLIADNRQIAAELAAATDALVAETRGQVTDATEGGRRLIGSSLVTLVAAAAIGIVLSLAIGWLYVGRSVVGRLIAVRDGMLAVAEGREPEALPAIAGDEIGAMVQALAVFKDNAAAVARLEEERRATERRTAEQRRAMVEALADRFEGSVQKLVEDVVDASRSVQEAAGRLSVTIDTTRDRTAVVGSASGEATAQVNAVAAAAAELSASIDEIARQATRSRDEAARAANAAEATDRRVGALSRSAERIGDIVRLIDEIASRTNLLALNATIEAARAGEAGKGFAVVASEVKGLAVQTARATGDIAELVQSIRSDTQGVIGALGEIEAVVADVNETAAAIAAAVEEQGAATRDIARAVNEAAVNTGLVGATIVEVSSATEDASSASVAFRDAAAVLSQSGASLSDEVGRFVRTMRA